MMLEITMKRMIKKLYHSNESDTDSNTEIAKKIIASLFGKTFQVLALVSLSSIKSHFI